MSDREFGEHLGGFAHQLAHRLKSGNRSDPIARAIEAATGIDASEVLFVAHVSRDTNGAVRAYVNRTFAIGGVAA